MVSKKVFLIGIIIIIGLIIFVYISNPSQGPILPCKFNKITGLYCPGCGMTRAVHSALKLDFYQSFRYNSLLYLMPPLIALYFYLKHKHVENLSKAILILMLVIAIGYGILRNIPYFKFLSPTNINYYDINLTSML